MARHRDNKYEESRARIDHWAPPRAPSAPAKCVAHFAAVIESTWIVLVLASSVPATITFFATNFSGVFWSLSV